MPLTAHTRGRHRDRAPSAVPSSCQVSDPAFPGSRSGRKDLHHVPPQFRVQLYWSAVHHRPEYRRCRETASLSIPPGPTGARHVQPTAALLRVPHGKRRGGCPGRNGADNVPLIQPAGTCSTTKRRFRKRNRISCSRANFECLEHSNSYFSAILRRVRNVSCVEATRRDSHASAPFRATARLPPASHTYIVHISLFEQVQLYVVW